jgi:hypothetical protein
VQEVLREVSLTQYIQILTTLNIRNYAAGKEMNITDQLWEQIKYLKEKMFKMLHSALLKM